MSYKKLSSSGYLLRLNRGEELFEELEKFCRERKIRAGWFWAIGALERATLSYYSLRQRKYLDKKFNRLLEVASLTGNIAEAGGKSVFHAHAVLGDKNCRAYAGHLKRGVVGGTLEIYLRAFGKKIPRKRHPASGLNLMDLHE